MIRLRDVSFRYPTDGFHLAIPELDIADGERVALIGRSGCGKTTLANIIAGILPAGSGTVEVDGAKLHELSDAARRDFRISKIGFIFQEFELIDYLRGEENIFLPYLVNGAISLGAPARQRLTQLAETAGIADKLKRFPAELSQGEKQRLAICRALITEPRLLVADEPTGNLDPETSHTVMDLLHEQVKSSGATMVAITHDHALLDGFDRTIDIDAFFSSTARDAA